MDNKLEIIKNILNNVTELKLLGRLDANWAVHLDDYLKTIVRDGVYDIAIDMSQVQYISSAGIRVLVKHYKDLEKIGGSLYLSAVSNSVSEVLEMVGLRETLSMKPDMSEAEQSSGTKTREISGMRFESKDLSTNANMAISFHGDPSLIKESGYTAEHNHVIPVEHDQFGLGLGAMGTGFNDCKNRYGEFIALGNALACLPGDGSKVPDFTVRTGRLIPKINVLYAMFAKGTFSKWLSFSPSGNSQSIELSRLIEVIFDISLANRVVVLMVAESSGLIGISLNKSPVGENTLFDFPEIKETINYTTEPAHIKKLTLSIGYFSRTPSSLENEFLRPLKPGSDIKGHVHTAVFPYQLLRKGTTDYLEVINNLFETSTIEDILHLTNDTNEIDGLGESMFKHGYCWIGLDQTSSNTK